MPKPTVAAIVRHPDHGALEVLNPAKNYAPDDPVVRAFAWAFVEPSTVKRESVPVEAATAGPGEKRARR